MNRIDRLTSIRGFAALYVVLFHCQEIVGGFDLRPWTGLIEKGYLAVDFFFVLSGFILAYVYASEFDAGSGRYRRFLSLRLARIYPVHLMTVPLAMLAVLPFTGFSENAVLRNTPGTLLSNLLLIHSWGFDGKLSWNFPSWSISAEWFAYLGFPFYLAATRPFTGRPFRAVVAAVACLGSFGMLANALLSPGVTIAGVTLVTKALANRPFDVTADFGILRVVVEFVTGLLLFRAYGSLRVREHRWLGAASVASVMVLMTTLHAKGIWPAVQDPLAVSAMAALILCLALDQRFLARALEHRIPVYLGEASYSIYMVHGVVALLYYQLVQARLLSPSTTLLGGSVVSGIGIAIVVLLGILTYEYFEVPARGILRTYADRMLGGRRQPVCKATV